MRKMADEDQALRAIVLEMLAGGVECYSVDFWREWCARGCTWSSKRNGVAKVSRVLVLMERDGLLTSREVLPEEHKETQYARRYYKKAEGGGDGPE